MGFEYSPPDQYVAADGKPSGPVFEIIDRTARRRNIRLRWIYSPQGPEKAMSAGAVDLWPLFGDLPDRRGHYCFSKPWASQQFWLMVESDSPIHSAKDISGKVLAVRYPGTNERVARLTLHPARTLRLPGFTEGAGALCAHQADAVFIWERAGRSIVLDLPPACNGRSLRYIGLSNAQLSFGVGASLRNPEARYAADAIRAEVSRLSREGFLNGVYFTWTRQSSSDTLVIDLIDALRRRSLWLVAAQGLLVLVHPCSSGRTVVSRPPGARPKTPRPPRNGPRL
jgi:ABC-type amino acid transport substrate-binding protein